METVWLDDSTGNATTSLNFNSLTRSDSGQYRVSITNFHEVVPVDQRTDSNMFELTVKGEFINSICEIYSNTFANVSLV